MRKFIVSFIIFVLIYLSGFTQVVVNTAEDTAFVMERVYYPQMQIKMSITFVTSDFLLAPKKNIKMSDGDSIEKLIVKEPGRADHYLALSSFYNEFNRTIKADSLRKLAKELFIGDLMKNSADTHAIQNLANIYLGELNGELATAYFNELTKQVPASSAGWNGLALISMANYDFKNAISYMDKGLQAEPDKIENYCQMANIMMMKSVFDLDSYDSTIMDTLTYKGMINTSFLENALKQKPGDPSISAMLDALKLTSIIYQAFIDNSDKFTGRGDSVIFVLSKSCTVELSSIENRMKTYADKAFHDKEFPYACLMLINFLRNDPDQALEWFKKGIKLNPRSQNLYENMTGIYALSMRKEPAYKLQLKLDSIHPNVTNLLMTAYFYYLDKKFGESKIWTQKVLALEPNNFNALMGMAALSTHDKKFGEAASFLDKAAGINPEHPDVLLLTGILYLLDNSPQMAKSTFGELLKNNQSTIEVDELMDRFLKQ
jgi:tetratricopeptide (TPR) repeat protein